MTGYLKHYRIDAEKVPFRRYIVFRSGSIKKISSLEFGPFIIRLERGEKISLPPSLAPPDVCTTDSQSVSLIIIYFVSADIVGVSPKS
jgi:hypothetical protein